MIQPPNPCDSNTSHAFKHSVFGFSPTFTSTIQYRKLKVLLCLPSSAKADKQALFLQLQRWWEEGRWGWGIGRYQVQVPGAQHGVGHGWVRHRQSSLLAYFRFCRDAVRGRSQVPAGKSYSLCKICKWLCVNSVGQPTDHPYSSST